MNNGFIDVIQNNISEVKDKHYLHFIDFHKQLETTLSYTELDLKAKKIAGYLREYNKTNSKTVIILLEPGIDYICSILGCFYAGFIAIPLYPPLNLNQMETLKQVLKQTEPAIVLVSDKIKKGILKWNVQEFIKNSFNIRKFKNNKLSFKEKVVNINHIYQEQYSCFTPSSKADDIAFLQYTSGSTSAPKGVMLSYKNLLENAKLIEKNFALSQESIVVSWLPPYHDMGLIGNLLQTMYLGSTCINFSPVDFIISPIRWLKTITRFKGNASSAPNFAYDLCVKKITQEDLCTLDLSEWKLALSGAEPVHPDTIKNFTNTFSCCGFNKKSFKCCYGLAEATVFVSGTAIGEELKIIELNKVDYLEGRVKLNSNESTGESIIKVPSCGIPSVAIKIVNPTTHQLCKNQEIGEIWIKKKDSITSGYWKNNESTTDLFATLNEDGIELTYLRTGDLGFIYDDELHVSGRLKDILILQGRNYFPQDFEYIASQFNSIRKGRVIAFAQTIEETDKLVLIAECKVIKDKSLLKNLAESICTAIYMEYHIPVYNVVLCSPGTILVTSSGKVRRQPTKKLVIDNQLNALFELSHAHNEKQVNHLTPIKNLDEIESMVLTIWQDVFGNKDINIDANFFNLGGNSIFFAQIYNEIQKKFHINFDYDKFSEAISINDQVIFLKSLQKPNAPSVAIKSSAAIKLTKMLPIQILCFERSLLLNNSGLLPAAIMVSQPLYKKKFILNFQNFLKQNPQLSSTFHKQGNVYYSEVKNTSNLPISFMQIEEDQDFDRCLMGEKLGEKIDLTADIPLRIIIQYKKERFLVGICAHHIAVDFISYTKLISCISLFNRSPELNFFEKFNYKIIQNTEVFFMDKQKISYWLSKNLFQNDTPIINPGLLKYNSNRIIFDDKLINKIKEICIQYNISISLLFIALIEIFIKKIFKDNSPTIGCPYLKRSQAETNLAKNDIYPGFDYLLINNSNIDNIDNEKIFFLNTKEKIFESYQNQVSYLDLIQLFNSSILKIFMPLFNYQVVFNNANDIPKGLVNFTIDEYVYFLDNPPMELTLCNFIFLIDTNHKIQLKTTYSNQLSEENIYNLSFFYSFIENYVEILQK